MMILVAYGSSLSDPDGEWSANLKDLTLQILTETRGADHTYRFMEFDPSALTDTLQEANATNRALAVAKAAMDAHPSDYAIGLVGYTGSGGHYSIAIIDGEGRTGTAHGPSLSDPRAQLPIEGLLRRFTDHKTCDEYLSPASAA